MKRNIALITGIVLLTFGVYHSCFGEIEYDRKWFNKSKEEKLADINKEIEIKRKEDARTDGQLGENFNYDYSQDEDKKMLLKSTMKRVKAAKKEMQEILKDAKIHESPKGGLYVASTTTKKARFSMVFRTAEGGIREFSKFITEKNNSDISDKKQYGMYFYGNGNIKYYNNRRLGPKENIEFNRDGKLVRYSITLENGMYYSLTLNEDGSVKKEISRQK